MLFFDLGFPNQARANIPTPISNSL